MSRPPTTWPNAARALATRVALRERVGAVLLPLGRALLAAGAAALALRLLGTASPWPEAVLAAGALVGLVGAAAGVRRVAPVRPADAAWALDRLAGAGERGLVAATVPGAVGAEAAWAEGRVDPPPVRLHPPRGFATLMGGVLAVALALIVPPSVSDGDAAGAPGGGDEIARAATPGAPGGPGTNPGEARAAAARARAAASVREALGLGAQEAADPEAVAERLALEQAREAAEDAAPEGSELAALLAEGASAADIADALAAGAEAEAEARGARRRQAALRAREGIPALGPERRAVVERYFWLLGEAEGEPGDR